MPVSVVESGKITYEQNMIFNSQSTHWHFSKQRNFLKIHLSVLNYTITQLLWWKYFNSDWSNCLIKGQRSAIINTYQDNMGRRSATQDFVLLERVARSNLTYCTSASFFSFCHALDTAQVCLLWSFCHALQCHSHGNPKERMAALAYNEFHKQKRTFGETAEYSKLNP